MNVIYSVPNIFWITLSSLAALLTLATLLGRIVATLYPHRIKGPARFYLSPVLGLAMLTLIASMTGRILPLGNSVIPPILIVSLLVWALIREQHVTDALRHALLVSVFGIFCGASVLGPLYGFGAFNAHNDGFTYLVHANWLQEHAFNETIPVQSVTPVTTQISLYQQKGFRMGGSFLLALAQALLNLRWSYEAYPAVLIAAITACCLAIGFPLSRSLQPIRRSTRLALLALPAFSLGGLVFGANFGFLPQTLGLTLGAGLLFSVGQTFRWIVSAQPSVTLIARTIFPTATLFAAAVFAYSELAPFLVVAVTGSGILLVFRRHGQARLLLYMVLLFGLAALLLNTELIRVYSALHTQSGAVVGSPVDWSLLGYAAHSIGVHGGAWDGFQWTTPENAWSSFFILGIALSVLSMLIISLGRHSCARSTMNGELLPVTLILMSFFIGLFYFRYFVPSPFPKGTGQSWSEFKLADWAHPFTAVFVILGAISLGKYIGKYFAPVVGTLSLLGFISTTYIGIVRTTPLLQYYGNPRDLNHFYQEFRKTVIANCSLTAPIFLALQGPHHKFRQMAAYFLSDREVSSDWMDDGYIFPLLPTERQIQPLNSGTCIVEPIGDNSWLEHGTTIGPFRIGMYDGEGRVRITSSTGAYGLETDKKNWWYWVESKIVFKLQSIYVPKNLKQTKLSFEYGTRGEQALTVLIQTRTGNIRRFELHGEGTALTVFENVIDLSPNELTEISIETSGQATQLSEQDKRMAAFIVRNVSIIPVSL